jgi:hypothetical protein
LDRGLASQKIGGIELPPGPEVGTRLLGGSQAVSLGYMRHITTTDIALSLGYILWQINIDPENDQFIVESNLPTAICQGLCKITEGYTPSGLDTSS